jgi:hypothetical protein
VLSAFLAAGRTFGPRMRTPSYTVCCQDQERDARERLTMSNTKASGGCRGAACVCLYRSSVEARFKFKRNAAAANLIFLAESRTKSQEQPSTPVIDLYLDTFGHVGASPSTDPCKLSSRFPRFSLVIDHRDAFPEIARLQSL